MEADSIEPTVLVVDDEREVADSYALELRKHYNVETAYGGEEALELVGPDTDVVLLDRRMPTSGDEVLRRIRDRELDCRVIMVTAVDPEFDILDMSFDDYLCKPVEDGLFTAIDQQLRIVAYDLLSEYFELAAKQSLLEAQLSPERFQRSDEYAAIEDRLAELEPRLRGLLDDFDEIVDAFDAVDREV